ncbi:MAG TPA: hypothetical protein PLN52_14495 [Opitutaceae bacterium]|nr:hypothetical protein [Opitutaceae bacterium]
MKFIPYQCLRSGAVLLLLVGPASFVGAQDTSDKPKQLPSAIVRKYDADRDGVLNEEEKAAWKADVQRGRQEAQARRLEKFDTNRDGKLDKAEKATAASEGAKPKKVESRKKSTSEGGAETPTP